MADTTTVLNAGTGGDSMDETSAVQSDASTTAKRPRVEVALADEGLTPRLVSKVHPLPVTNEEGSEVLLVLKDILNELRCIRAAIEE